MFKLSTINAHGYNKAFGMDVGTLQFIFMEEQMARLSFYGKNADFYRVLSVSMVLKYSVMCLARINIVQDIKFINGVMIKCLLCLLVFVL